MTRCLRRAMRGSVSYWGVCAVLVSARSTIAAGPDAPLDGAGGGGELDVYGLENADDEPADAALLERVVWAVNAGGDGLVGSHGVIYGPDSATDRVASGGTEALVPVDVKRVDVKDLPLYQTERYSLSNFFYDIPTPKEEGRYTLVLKFAEVAFHEEGKKIFNVVLNGKHTIVRDLDIFAKVGHGVAYDEYVSFVIKGDTLKYRRKQSKLTDTIRVEFVKGHNDNPKVCALVLVRGDSSVAHTLVGVAAEPDSTKAAADVSGPTANDPLAAYVDGEDMDGRGRRKRRHAGGDDESEPFPINSVVMGALVLAVVLLVENYLGRNAT